MTDPIKQAPAAVEPVVTRDEARLLADRFAEYVFADRQWVTREDLKPGMGVYDALSEFFREALATVEHNARREANACWHCKVCLDPAERPRCESCPSECDDENCQAEGCQPGASDD